MHASRTLVFLWLLMSCQAPWSADTDKEVSSKFPSDDRDVIRYDSPDDGRMPNGEALSFPLRQLHRTITGDFEDARVPDPIGRGIVLQDSRGRELGRFHWGDTEFVRHLAPPHDPSLGLYGVDLGVNFVENGNLRFLFGDAWTTTDLWDRDPTATLELGTSPDNAELAWQRGPTGRFEPIGFTEDVGTAAFEVPVEGLRLGDTSYVFYASDFDSRSYRHRTSVLGHTRDGDFSALEVDHAVASKHFININATLQGDTIWLFGSGDYRRSPVFLARANANTLAKREEWAYFAGQGEGGELWFTSNEVGAAPLIDSECVGELSVRRDPRRQYYLMTYNCMGSGHPRGIHLRLSKTPYGPWSNPIVIFDPDRDGYGLIMHSAVCAEGVTTDCVDEDDGLSDPGREQVWGGEYGPYLIEPWISSEDGLLTIHYVLSTWNPYAVHLMKTTLVRQG